MNNKIEEMKELVNKLNKWSYEYYTLGQPSVEDSTYDNYYDKLLQLEKETNTILSNSPTQKVGNEILSKLKKVKHEYPLLSLGKTKSYKDIIKFRLHQVLVQQDKMDGLTIDLTYDNGLLIAGDTRGNGEEGEDILHNVKTFSNIPLKINYKKKVHIIGEAIIDYDTFNKINEKLPNDKQYKNPRNLVSGTVRQLDSSICKQRNVRFIGYIVEGNNELLTKQDQLEFIREQGFEVVNYNFINPEDTEQDIENKLNRAKKYAESQGLPIDGQVITYNDIKYGKSLGVTSHHPKHSLAFKFTEDVEITKLTSVEWQVGRTGVVTPVANFETVELAGTEVSKASLHNLSILKSLKLGIGDEVSVCKKNEIIPQIIDNITKSNTLEIPTKCPICGEELIIKNDTESEFLYCNNPNCKAKLIQSISHYCSRNAMNIEGLSEKTIEKFIEKGFIKSLIDIYSLKQYKKEIINMDGLGIRSYDNLIQSIEKSKECKLENFIFGLGIPNVGLQTAKGMVKYINISNNVKKTLEDIVNTTYNDWLKMNDCGEVLAKSLINYFSNEKLKEQYYNLADLQNFIQEQQKQNNSNISLEGKVFVVTGDVHIFKNRKELQNKIEELGGKNTGSVSKKTTYLINNDGESNTGKNKKAKELGIQIITEQDFIDMIGGLN